MFFVVVFSVFSGDFFFADAVVGLLLKLLLFVYWLAVVAFVYVCMVVCVCMCVSMVNVIWFGCFFGSRTRGDYDIHISCAYLLRWFRFSPEWFSFVYVYYFYASHYKCPINKNSINFFFSKLLNFSFSEKWQYRFWDFSANNFLNSFFFLLFVSFNNWPTKLT